MAPERDFPVDLDGGTLMHKQPLVRPSLRWTIAVLAALPTFGAVVLTDAPAATAQPPGCTPDWCPPPPVNTPPPAGTLEAARRVPTGVAVSGQLTTAFAGAVKVRIFGDGHQIGEIAAAKGQPFSGILPVSANEELSITAVAVNSTNVVRSLTGSIPVTVIVDPIGDVESVSPGPAGLHVRGLALDMDSYDPIDVRVTVDGALAATVKADVNRPDAGDPYGYGTKHGWDVTIPAGKGKHTVCAVGVNVGPGSDGNLRCGTVDQGGVPSKPTISAEPKAGSVVVTVDHLSGDTHEAWTERRPDTSGSWERFGLNAHNPSGSFVRTSEATPGRRYCFKAVAKNDYGSIRSDETCVTALWPALPLPGDLRAIEIGTDSVIWGWTDRASDEDEYRLRVDDRIARAAAVPGVGGTGRYVQTKLTPNTTTCVSVAAVKADHDVAYSNRVCVTTKPVPRSYPRFSAVALWNCDSRGRTGTMWAFDASIGYWSRVGSAPAMWRNGACGSGNSEPSQVAVLPQDHLMIYALVVPDGTCADDPTVQSCRRWEMLDWIQGDRNAPAWFVVV